MPTEVIARNNAGPFTAFLNQPDRAIAPGEEIHVVLDNGSSHIAKPNRWTYEGTPLKDA